MSLPEVDRKKAREDAEQRSKHNDMKQHADKLIQGFQKLTDSHARRAIWELFQNAVDLSEHAEIIIELTPEKLIFKHNGKPFDDNTLNCLIKQVSSKSPESNDEQIGQYGTGFITTHSFGRKILLTGSLEQDEYYIPLKEFVIDRTPKTSLELIENLIKQQESVFNLIENEKYQAFGAPLTEFAYLTDTELQKIYAKDAIATIPLILPIVMMLNARLKKVTVVDQTENQTEYQKVKEETTNDIVETQININNEPQFVYSLQDKESGISIILPVVNKNQGFKFNRDLSKLFLFYPLIGTESLGINFLIHAKHFSPTEQRDGIYLNSKTEQVQENEKSNREIIEKASQSIFNFAELHSRTIVNPIHLAQINYPIHSEKQLLNDYFIELKSKWVEKFKTFGLVETDSNRITPSQAVFLHPDLLTSEKAYNAIYNLISKFWSNIPKKELAKEWTQVIGEWNDPSIKYVSRTDLALKIQAAGNHEAFDIQDLIVFYESLIELGHSGLFNDYKLLPNIKGEFRSFSALNNQLNLPVILIEIADVIMPDVPKRHVHKEFKFSLDFTPYTRENYTADINEHIAKIVKEKSSSLDIPSQYLHELVRYCKLVSNKNSDSVPSKLMKLVAEYYKLNTELIEITDLSKDELDIRPPQKRLLRLFLTDLGRELPVWVAEKQSFLIDIISLGSGYHDFEDLFQTLPVFPNQLNELATQSSLSAEENIPEDIKKLFNKVVKPDKPIQSTLVHSTFAKYLKSKEKKSIRSLTEKIETIFSEDGQYTNVNDHHFINEILEIINRISSDPEWGKHFPLLNSKRANIMLARVTDERIKEDVFAIVSLKPAQINKLGELARNPEIDEIIQLGQQSLEAKKKNEEELDFKKTIGKHVENLIREKLNDTAKGFSAKVEDEQGGQDIVVRLNKKILYYIEVKSRWDIKSSIRISYAQCNRAVRNKEIFSLCAVNMVDYRPTDGTSRHLVDDIGKITDRIRFVNDIGGRIEPLIATTLIANSDEVHLSDDYRAVVPQTVITNNSISLEKFIEFIVSLIEQNV